MKALIIGGTRGIGQATARALRGLGWDVTATGKRKYNVHRMAQADQFGKHEFDALVFCAGDIQTWGIFAFDFPLAFYSLALSEIVAEGGVIVAVSSVAAGKPAKVNAHYAAAKAALESYALTVSDSEPARRLGWTVRVVRFDLVDTDMARRLPAETLAGRVMISAEEAARQILVHLC